MGSAVHQERTRRLGIDLPRAVETMRRASEAVRPLVSASWNRSLAFGVDRDAAAPTRVVDQDLRGYRDTHPLAAVLPVIQRLLVRHTIGSGLIVAIGDQNGRLLWIDGDRDLRRRAEAMAFVEGAVWSEQIVGTSAPGTALALGHSVQIAQDEHFTRIVHPWSCSAVPVRNRATGELLGVIDITGGADAVAPITLPLLEATAAAVEAELSLLQPEHAHSQLLVHRAPSVHSAKDIASRRSSVPAPPRFSAHEPELNVLGRDEGALRIGASSSVLSMRHAELLTLLAWNSSGLSAGDLARAIYGRDDAVVTLRAEMVRLRRALTPIAPALTPLSRPYRLPTELKLDAQHVLAFLDRGAHRVAFSRYPGPVLPGSASPGIEVIRHAVSSRLRESLLTDANVDILLTYAHLPEARHDVELWRACLRMLPPRSPRRAAVVAHLEHIETELA